MKWIEFSVAAPPEFVEPITHIFYKYGHGGVAVEEEGGFNPDEGELPPSQREVTIRTYLPLDATTDDRRSRIDIGIRLVSHLAPLSPLRERVLDETDWQEAWKEHFDVLRIGSRTVICPTWRDHTATPGEYVITLDPGMAFGTGHHPSTRACLEAMESIVRTGSNVLDVGCGSGILSIAAAKMGAALVLGVEIDPIAVRIAEENVRENRAGAIVNVIEGTLPSTAVTAGSYDVVVANISANVAMDLSGELATAAMSGGRVIASGIIEERRPGVLERFEQAGLRVDATVVDGDWVTLLCTRS